MPKVFLGSQSVQETTVNVGPIDPSVLWGQSNHRSSDTHANQQISFRCLKVEDNIISEEAKTIVQAVGLWDVAYISHPKLDPKLLTALCERWRPETHTFHLPHGEMTITLEDVAVLLGLRVHGEAVIDNYVDEEDIVGACVELLGLDLPDGRKDFVQIKQLRQNLLEAQLTAEQQARTFILIILGGVLFTTTKKDNVSLIYLPLLRNLQEAAQYSWGSAVLAVTYRGLCEASQLNVATFSGCAILVQLWSWERLHVGRPVLKGELPAGELHPLGYRWSFLKRSYNHQVRIPNLAYYRDDLESQSSDQVTWMPYSTLQLDITPPVCCDQPELFRVKVPLIHFNVVEWHRPDRVMRQFGLNQHIPEITTNEIQEHVRVHKLTRKGPHLERRWTIRHQDFLTLWVNRADYVQQERKPYTDYNQYITWYHNITRRFITAPRPSTGETLQGHPPSTPFVLHGGEVGTVMNIMAKGVPFARKAAKGGLKFTKNNFKLLADHYLETCRLSYDAVGQLPMYEEHVRRADLDIANEQQIGESEPERRPSELWQGVRVRGALGRGRNGESSSRGVYKPSIKFRAVEFHRKNELSMDKSQPEPDSN